MPSVAALTIYLFGITAFAAGVHNLLNPSTALASQNLPDTIAVRPAADGLALAATAMGMYYTILAYQENKVFFVLTVPMRLLTASVFLGHGAKGAGMESWKIAGAWEGMGALITALGLIWDYARAKKGIFRARKER